VVPACRTLDTVSIFARDVADAFGVFQLASAFDDEDAYCRSFLSPPFRRSRAASGWACLVRINGSFLATGTRHPILLAESLGARLVEFDFEPFAEVARLLYEGPWVAERYAATKPLIATNPGALYPVTRAIIEGARKFDAVSAFEAFYRLGERKRHEPRLVGIRRDAGSNGAAPLYGR
jgi:allophanate hydrolase